MHRGSVNRDAWFRAEGTLLPLLLCRARASAAWVAGAQPRDSPRERQSLWNPLSPPLNDSHPSGRWTSVKDGDYL